MEYNPEYSIEEQKTELKKFLLEIDCLRYYMSLTFNNNAEVNKTVLDRMRECYKVVNDKDLPEKWKYKRVDSTDSVKLKVLYTDDAIDEVEKKLDGLWNRMLKTESAIVEHFNSPDGTNT